MCDGVPALQADWEELIVDENVGAVIVGQDVAFTYAKLAYASLAIQQGAKFVATNPDAADALGPGLMVVHTRKIGCLVQSVARVVRVICSGSMVHRFKCAIGRSPGCMLTFMRGARCVTQCLTQCFFFFTRCLTQCLTLPHARRGCHRRRGGEGVRGAS